jgi:hypothetical protein
MRQAIRGSDTEGMSPDSRRLELEIDADSDPISGRLGDGRHDWEFTGWLGLATALQSALGTEDDDPVGPLIPDLDHGGRPVEDEGEM